MVCISRFLKHIVKHKNTLTVFVCQHCEYFFHLLFAFSKFYSSICNQKYLLKGNTYIKSQVFSCAPLRGPSYTHTSFLFLDPLHTLILDFMSWLNQRARGAPNNSHDSVLLSSSHCLSLHPLIHIYHLHSSLACL